MLPSAMPVVLPMEVRQTEITQRSVVGTFAKGRIWAKTRDARPQRALSPRIPTRAGVLEMFARDPLITRRRGRREVVQSGRTPRGYERETGNGVDGQRL